MGKLKNGCGGCLAVNAVLAVLAVIGVAVAHKDKLGPASIATNSAAPVLGPDVINRETEIAEKHEALAQAPSPAVSAAVSSKPHLRATVSQLRGWYEKADIVFRPAPLADGTPRLLGQNLGSFTTVELIGPGETLESASITIGMVEDHPDALIFNMGVLIVFMRETGWPGGEKWVTSVMQKDNPPPKAHGGVSYSVMTSLRGSGLYIITAAPVDAPKPAAD